MRKYSNNSVRSKCGKACVDVKLNKRKEKKKKERRKIGNAAGNDIFGTRIAFCVSVYDATSDRDC